MRPDPSGATTSRAQPESQFTGPVFIVGMPRSGTKLLRDLLRGHPLIRIPPTESNFLPRWVADWQGFGDLSDRERFAAFYRRAIRNPYFLLMEKHTGGPLPEDVWYESCDGYGPAEVFEALIRHDVGAPRDSELIWGDKSPAYTEHIALLGELFPDARIIHVVRDVRDYCLSLRKTWGKNMIRGAQRWADGVIGARRDGEALRDRYIEVRYEDLLAHPERELGRCCELLEVEFRPSLAELRFTTEHLGDAKGAGTIVPTNVRKFETALEPRTRRRIEAIAADALRAYGYEVDDGAGGKRVPRPFMRYYQAVDAAHFVLGQSRRSGLLRTARLQIVGRIRG